MGRQMRTRLGRAAQTAAISLLLGPTLMVAVMALGLSDRA